jgi:hypothetical protein
MKTYKVFVMKTARHEQTVFVQAHSEEEAERKVEYYSLWNDDSWEFRDEHYEVLMADEAEENEIVECILSEATHFWSNGILHEIDGTVVQIWIEDEKDFIENGKAIGIKIYNSDKGHHTYIDEQNFTFLGIKPVQLSIR